MAQQLTTAAGPRLVALAEVQRFVRECVAKAGAPDAHARAMASVLAEADRRGHFSHGLNRLDMYVNDLQSGLCDGAVTPRVLRETPATAWVDGCNGLGPVVGTFCMELAIRKARETGVGWVAAKGSNHFGIAAWYSMMALKENMIGMSFTNTSPFLSPTRSKQAALGTNPLSLAAPAEGGDSYVLDMATTAVAVGKIEVQRRRGERIPAGWAQDASGAATTDPDEAMNVGCLMPLGGAESTSGYKGYGLALMVELLCGVLAGATYGPDVRKWMGDEDRPADLGQCFVAVDPQCFAPGFEGRLQDLLSKLRAMEPADPAAPVLVAGDPERAHEAKVEREGGVSYHPSQIIACEELAKSLGVQPMDGR
ncbi:hypothetical protein R5R35_009283 [Gryllus longicercus]|uniref:Malate dehydrogenase n=1 Tax=Gryllus longicercus TaxID=2509291 RepID=A0AAN9W320_9ORTH